MELLSHQVPANTNANVRSTGKEMTVPYQIAQMGEFPITTHVQIVRSAIAVDFAIMRMRTVNYVKG